jgi:hypothetical protein
LTRGFGFQLHEGGQGAAFERAVVDSIDMKERLLQFDAVVRVKRAKTIFNGTRRGHLLHEPLQTLDAGKRWSVGGHAFRALEECPR